MLKYHVEKSIEINVPAEQVRAAITHFEVWPVWSPWLLIERDAKLTYHGSPGQVGHGYAWDGQAVGAGNMKLASVTDSLIEMDLGFIRPFKSSADVKFEINETGTRPWLSGTCMENCRSIYSF